MKYSSTFRLTLMVCGVAGAIVVAIPEPVIWHSGFNDRWSQVLNWGNAGGGAPTSGDVDLKADNVCDPLATDPPCEVVESPLGIKTCQGGPYDGLSCSTSSDCDCDGGSYIPIWDFTSVTPAYSLGQINVVANASHAMTLQKGSATLGNRQMNISDLNLDGDSSASNQAILDVQENNINVDDLLALGQTKISVASGKTAAVDTLLRVGASDETGSTCELTGAGTIDVSAGGSRVKAFSTTSDDTTTIKVNMSGVYKVGDLEVTGQNSATRLGLFDWDAGTVNTIDSVTMQGYSKIDVDASSDLTVNGNLIVNTGTTVTDATIEMPSGKTFQANSINITGGDASGESAKLTIASGILKSLGGVSLDGGTAANTGATLKIPVGAGVPSFVNLTMYDDSILDADQDVAFTNFCTIGDSSATIDVAAERTVTCDVVVVEGGVSVSPTLGTGAVIQSSQ